VPRLFRPLLVVFTVLTLITGVLYPLVITLLAQALFPAQAMGSVIQRDGRAIGSTLIGQNFSDPGHFWGRPSATSPQPYHAANSGGSNLGPRNPALLDAVGTRLAALRAADPGQHAPVPVDLVTASASGLDPEISLAGALWQADRVARLRGLRSEAVKAPSAVAKVGRPLGKVIFGAWAWVSRTSESWVTVDAFRSVTSACS